MIVLILIFSIIISSCGRNDLADYSVSDATGSSASTSIEEISAPTILTGSFLDSAVEGIDFSSGGTTGTTDGAGTFEYEEGEEISFSIGGVSLGTASGGETVTPVDLVPGGDADSDAVVNIARFLQTLDADGDPSNGITVSDDVKQEVRQAGKQIRFDVPPAQFASDQDNLAVLNRVLSRPLDNGSSRQIKSESDAKAHLKSNLEKIKNGVKDLLPPHSVDLKINDGDESTDDLLVTLDLKAKDDVGVTAWYASESESKPNFSNISWNTISPASKDYSGEVSFQLQSADKNSSSQRKVRVWFKDSSGQVSRPASATIVYSLKDSAAPTDPDVEINSNAASTTDANVVLNLTASDDSGVVAYLASESDETPEPDDVRWVSVQSSKNLIHEGNFTLTSGTSIGSYSRTVYVWFKDAAGRVSQMASDSIILVVADITAPQGVGVQINDGDATTNSTSVQLDLVASDTEGVTGYFISNSTTIPDINDNGWVSVLTQLSFSKSGVAYTLIDASAIGTHTRDVYVWFRDGAGNISAMTTDSIELKVLDTESPGDPVVVVENDKATTTIRDVSVSIAVTDNHGVVGYYISNTQISAENIVTWVEVEPSVDQTFTFNHTLSEGEGEKVVYAWTVDAEGNVSAVGYDKIDYNVNGYVRGIFDYSQWDMALWAD